MKKYTIFILIFISIITLFVGGCTFKQKKQTDLEKIIERGYLIVGVKTDSPPFGYYNSNNVLEGIDITLAKHIANAIFKEESPENIKFVKVTAQDRISKLNSKEVDMLVATMSVNSKRRLVIEFSDPYFETTQKIMVKPLSKIKTLTYFNKNGRLVVVMGTTGEKIIRLIAPNAQVIGAKTYREAYNLLLNDQADAIFGDDCILRGINEDNFKIVNRAYSEEYYAVAVRKSPDSEEMLNIVNSVIATLLDKKMLTVPKK